jgi:site-specific DNA-methyltransferase (adenine-specific)
MHVEEYRFAAEIAARHLEQKYRASLDQILCNPDMAKEFDDIASSMSPGFSPFEYRWAALQLRKTSKLKPELVLRIAGIKSADFGAVEKLAIDSLPSQQGIYIFYSSQGTLYVGEAMNLRKRVAKHLDHSDRKALAEWLWQHGAKDLRLEILVLPVEFDTRSRRAVERELIQTRKPTFNIQR